jgi:hypothetical protein
MYEVYLLRISWISIKSGFVEMLPNLSCRGGIPKFNHAPRAPPRRCGDPDWDRDCILVRGNIKERSGEPCPKVYLIGGAGRG